MLEKLKSRARAFQAETYAIYLAARDPRTPWYAKALIWFVVVHTFSPIDLIPDFIPILGYLDDLVITPVGLALALRLIPPMVLEEARQRVWEQSRIGSGPRRSRAVEAAGAVIVISIWVILLVWMVKFILAFGH